MRIRRTTTTVAAAALVLPLTLTTPAAAAPGDANPPSPRSTGQFCAPVPQAFTPFTDVAGDTHQAAIECAAYAEIARGGPGSLPAHRYGPGLPMQRDQMASLIARMMDTAEELDTGSNVTPLPAYDGSAAFSDVPESSPHFEAVNRLQQAGIVKGGPGGRPSDQYGPGLPTRRDQMASFINRAVEFMTGSAFSTANDYFIDDESSVHEDNINGVASAGVAVGDGNDRYAPNQVVPRDQMASFLVRTLAALHETGQITDVGAVTAAVVQYDQRGQTVEPGGTISGTIWGAADASSVHVSGDCVFDGGLTDADGGREGFQFSIPARAESAEGSCAVTFTTTFQDGSSETDTVDVQIGSGSSGTGQTFIVAPQQPRTAPVGEPVQFSVGSRYDEQRFTGPVDLTLFPCTVVDPTSSPVTFNDADGNRQADAIASTEQGQAYISRVEGVATGGRERYLEDQGPGTDGVLEFTTVAGPDADCAVVVVFADQNDDRQLAVDSEGRPTEPFGVGKVTWTGGSASIAAVAADGRAVMLDGTTGEVQQVLLEGVDVQDPTDNGIAVSPDRSTVYVVRPGASGTQDSEIVRVSASGGTPQTVTQGQSPAVSPNGSTLAYVRFVDVGGPTTEPTIRLRHLETGAERELRASNRDFYGIWNLAWSEDGSQIGFTAGEIQQGVWVVNAEASSLDEARRVGPQNNDASWTEVATLGAGGLAVVERCCDLPAASEAWHVVSVDIATGQTHGSVFGRDRTEASLIDARHDADGLIVVENRGPDGGPLLRWNGSGDLRAVTNGIIVAAW